MGLSGADLARRAVTQARRFGVEILTPQEVKEIRVEDPMFGIILLSAWLLVWVKVQLVHQYLSKVL